MTAALSTTFISEGGGMAEVIFPQVRWRCAPKMPTMPLEILHNNGQDFDSFIYP
jgi:hypothetical protein